MSTAGKLLRGRDRLLVCTALASSVTVAAAANAQNVPAPSPAPAEAPATTPPTAQAGAGQDNGGVQEIIVTAQKREQRLQDVPIAVTAITQAALVSNRVQNVSDISGLAPNVVVRESAGGIGIPSFSSRGIVSYGVVPGSDKEFSIYLDGVYIGSTAGSIFELPDIDRIEVLRGPQGTLFGRNSTTGATSIVTRDPTGKLSGRQVFTIGNYNEFRTQTSIDLPAFGPFSAYGSFVHEGRSGDIKNLGAGTVWDRTGPDTHLGVQASPRTLGGKNVESYFGALKFQPTSDFRMVYKFDHSSNHYTPAGQAVIGIDPNATAGGAPIGALLSTLIAESGNTPLDPSGKRPDAVNNAFSVASYQRVTGHNLTSTWQIGDHLSAKNIAAYRKSFVTSEVQLDGLGGLNLATPTAFNAYLNFAAAGAGLPPALLGLFLGKYAGDRFVGIVDQAQSQSKQYSDEQQINYTSPLLDLTVGGLYYHEKTRSAAPRGLPNNISFSPLPADGEVPLASTAVLGLTPSGFPEDTSYNKVTSIAGYAQAEVHVTDKLDLVAGGRVTHDHKTGTLVTGGNYVPGPSGGRTDGTFTDEVFNSFTYKNTKFTYSAGVNYKPSRDILLYGKYSTGFVSGGSVSAFAFKPETVKSAEVGAKTELLDRKLIANVALFYARYKDIQSAQSGVNVGAPDLGTVIIDQGNVKAKGFEFETTLAPVRGITLNGSLGYTDVDFGTVNPILVAGSGGQYLPTLIPKFTSNLSAQYESEPLFGDARFMARVDALWRDKERTEANPTRSDTIAAFAPIKFSPASWVVNARVALRDIGPMHAEVALWARNLNNNRSTLFPLDLGGFIATSTFQPARTYGLDLSVSF